MLGATAAGGRDARGVVETDVRRRIAEEKDPEHVARTTLRPSLDQVAFLNARQSDDRRDAPADLPARPAAGRPAGEGAARAAPRAARLPAHRARLGLDRRGPAGHPPPAASTAPARAGRALRRERLGGQLRVVHAAARLRAARAVRQGPRVHVRRRRARGHRRVRARRRPRGHARPGSPRAPATRPGSGAPSYGRAFQQFAREAPRRPRPEDQPAGPGRRPLQLHRPGAAVLREMVDASRHAWWLNPESRGQWDTGDSAAREYGEVVPMVECRNLTQLTELVHDLV